MRHIDKKIKSNIFYQVFTRPEVYLRNLLRQTCYIGAFTFFVYNIVDWLSLESHTFPSTMHSLIGFIIGLLLVFRNNSAYERWWDGRKLISTLGSEISLINARLNVKNKTNYILRQHISNFKNDLIELMLLIGSYLISKREVAITKVYEEEQNRLIERLFIHLNEIDSTGQSVSAISTSLNNIINSAGQLERIKNTPIPVAYVYHIKISMIIYLVSLPFGMFHDLGLFSVPLVMLLYYIIAGVEIISNEIENPFGKDPNDLPTEKLFQAIIKTIEYEQD